MDEQIHKWNSFTQGEEFLSIGKHKQDIDRCLHGYYIKFQKKIELNFEKFQHFLEEQLQNVPDYLKFEGLHLLLRGQSMNSPADLKVQGREDLNCLILSHLLTCLKGLLNEIERTCHTLSAESGVHLKRVESQLKNNICGCQKEINLMIGSFVQDAVEASINQKLKKCTDLYSLQKTLLDLNRKSEDVISMKKNEVRTLKSTSVNEVINTMNTIESRMQRSFRDSKSQEVRKINYLKKIIMNFSSDLMLQNKSSQFKHKTLTALLSKLELNVDDLNEFSRQQQYKIETSSMLTDSSFNENSVCSESLQPSQSNKSKLDLYRVGYF